MRSRLRQRKFTEDKAVVRVGAKIVAFTAHRTAPLPYADTVVRLPAQPTAAGLDAVRYSGSGSSDTARSQAPAGVLPPGSAYELALQLLLDTLAAMLQQENNVSDELMKSRLSNLE